MMELEPTCKRQIPEKTKGYVNLEKHVAYESQSITSAPVFYGAAGKSIKELLFTGSMKDAPS